MTTITRLTTASTFAFLCAGSFLIAAEPAAEWTFQGEDPLKDTRGGLVATLDESGAQGAVEVAAGVVTFRPQGQGAEAQGGVLMIPWSDLVARFGGGFTMTFELTYGSLDRSPEGKDLGVIDTEGKVPGPFRLGVNQGPNGEKYYLRLATEPTGDPLLLLVTDRHPSTAFRPIEVSISVEKLPVDRYRVSLSLDGEQIGSQEGEVFPVFDDTSLVLGSYVEGGRRENFFDGTISNFKIYPAPASP